MDENIINEIKSIAISSIKFKIEQGDLQTIRYYLDNINMIGDDTLVNIAINSLKTKIEACDISAIAVFYDYFSN